MCVMRDESDQDWSRRRVLVRRENFMIEAEVPPKDRRPCTSEAFTIVKSESYLRAYDAWLPAFYQDQFLNLGFFREGAMCS